MDYLNLSVQQKDTIKNNILHKEAEQLRKKRKKIAAADYESIKIIGKGAFGEVRCCKDKSTGEVIAIKKMKKNDMLNKN